MRKIIILLIVSAICISILTSCSLSLGKQNSEVTDLDENTDKISTTETSIIDTDEAVDPIYLEDGAKYVFAFGCLDYLYLGWCQSNGYIPENIDLNSLVNEYVNIFGRTEDANNIALMDYYDIPQNTYISYWNYRRESDAKSNNYDSEAKKQFEQEFKIELAFDDWFSEDVLPADNKTFINPYYKYDDPKSVVIRCADDEIHTSRYYTINGFLVQYVGEDGFNEFKNKYAGTQEFNILNFIKYFDISKEEFDAIYESEDYHSICIPYKSEYLYGTPEMQATYFEKHPIP